MKSILWVGDAVVSSGFARCTHHILKAFVADGWRVSVLGLNYPGDPHRYEYPIYPCIAGGDPWGLRRLPSLITQLKPSVVVIQNDPWNVVEYLQVRSNVPTIAAMAVDGKNCKWAKRLNGLALAVFWTKFGFLEARAGGYVGEACVIPLGVDLETYFPTDESPSEVREKVKLPEKVKFVVGNVNRNQPRKRLDLTISFFAEWVKTRRISDAYLYLHVAPTGDVGYDCPQLVQYLRLSDRLIYQSPEVGYGVPEAALANVYRMFDVQVNTAQGEGWGLTTMEGMACGVPQIVPDCAALAEWTEDAAVRVPCNEVAVTPNCVNVIGGVPDRAAFISALDRLYESKDERARLSKAGIALVQRPMFDWANIGAKYVDAVSRVIYGT